MKSKTSIKQKRLKQPNFLKIVHHALIEHQMFTMRNVIQRNFMVSNNIPLKIITMRNSRKIREQKKVKLWGVWNEYR